MFIWEADQNYSSHLWKNAYHAEGPGLILHYLLYLFNLTFRTNKSTGRNFIDKFSFFLYFIYVQTLSNLRQLNVA